MITIEKHKLNPDQVESLVVDWYTNGMFKDILQTKRGSDLEEYIGEVQAVNVIDSKKLDQETVEKIVLEWYDNTCEVKFFNEDGVELNIILKDKE